MHIADGVLTAPVLVAGAAVAAAGIAIGLRKLDDERLPTVAVISSALFVASLIHVPVGPASAHLVLNGLAGVILGWAAFPALLISLFLQAILFGFGGLTVLGVNTTTMAVPAVACFYLLRRGLRSRSQAAVFFWGWVAGAFSVTLSCLLTCAALVGSGEEFSVAAGVLLLAHVPVMIVDGLVTGFVAAFLRRVCPELLDAAVPRPRNVEIAHE